MFSEKGEERLIFVLENIAYSLQELLELAKKESFIEDVSEDSIIKEVNENDKNN